MDQSRHEPANIGRRCFLKGAASAAAILSAPRARAQAPRFPPQSGETILVVGAGLAGLVAAHRLREAGRRVIVIEARDVPGGRVRTVRDFAGGLYGELGAARIADTHHFAIHWINELGLSLVPFQPQGGVTILALNGRRARSDDEAARARLASNLKPDERGLTPPQLLIKYIAGLPEELTSTEFDATEARWAEYDRVTWAQWLRSRGASDDAIALMTLGGHSSTLSALYLLRQIMLHRDSGGYLKIDGGFDRLPRGLAGRLSDSIRYGTELVRLDRTDRSVRATVRTPQRQETITADRVVLTIPFSVLDGIAVDPPFSERKTQIIQTLPYHPATRFIIETTSRFWERERLSGGARTDGPAEMWDMSFGQPGTRGLLSVTTGGEFIDGALAGLTPEQRSTYGALMARAAYPDIANQSQKVLAHRWGDEPYARGAFSVFRPGQMSQWSKAILAPEGRVHFAGEHTSAHSGWIEGAIWSGEHVAEEILQQ
jgi:monoamine oxidase